MRGAYFVGGTDTSIGKTVCTGLLARACIDSGLSVITQKLIQTGCKGISEDILEHRRIMQIPLHARDLDCTTCKFVLGYPASPHIAEKLENANVDYTLIAENSSILSKEFDVLLIEGAGGLMVPLKENFLTIDYLLKHELPLILVVPSRLGSLNHALLNLELVKKYSIKLWGIIYNTYPKEKFEIENSTRSYLKAVLQKDFPQANFMEVGEFNENL